MADPVRLARVVAKMREIEATLERAGPGRRGDPPRDDGAVTGDGPRGPSSPVVDETDVERPLTGDEVETPDRRPGS